MGDGLEAGGLLRMAAAPKGRATFSYLAAGVDALTPTPLRRCYATRQEMGAADRGSVEGDWWEEKESRWDRQRQGNCRSRLQMVEGRAYQDATTL
jgi:hypothetical protein